MYSLHPSPPRAPRTVVGLSISLSLYYTRYVFRAYGMVWYSVYKEKEKRKSKRRQKSPYTRRSSARGRRLGSARVRRDKNRARNTAYPMEPTEQKLENHSWSSSSSVKLLDNPPRFVRRNAGGGHARGPVSVSRRKSSTAIYGSVSKHEKDKKYSSAKTPSATNGSSIANIEGECLQ